jgi:hypothetical protein
MKPSAPPSHMLAAGATPWEMMAAGGWQNMTSIRPYFVGTPEQARSFQLKRESYRYKELGVDFILDG